MRIGAQIVTTAAAAAWLLVVGCAAPVDPAMRPYRINPFPMSSPEAEQLKYPPGGGVGAYWLDGRFDVTLDVLIDESKEGDKALIAEIVCFRQEGQRVYARNKSGQLLVLDLSRATFKVSREVKDFEAQDQAALQKLGSRTRGNIYIDPVTLMADL